MWRTGMKKRSDEIQALYQTDLGKYYIGKCEDVLKNLDLKLPNLANLTRDQKNQRLTEFFKNHHHFY